MTRKYKTYLALTVLFAITLRVAAYFILARHTHPAFWEYHYIAKNFLEGRGLVYDFFHIIRYAYAEPLYPLISALIYGLTKYNYVIFGMFNILVSGALSVIIFYLGKRIFDQSAGLLAALIVAVHPGLIYFSTEFHPLTFNAFFFAGLILLLLRAGHTLAIKDALWAGLFMGMAFLDRSSALIFMPLGVLAIYLAEGSIGKKVKIVSIILLVSSFMLAPWVIRNYAVFHKVVIARSSGGYLFWLGNNPNYTGSAMYDKNTSMLDTIGQESIAKMKRMGELEQDKYLMDKAFDFVKQDPKAFFARWGLRVGYFWWFSPMAGLLYPSKWLIMYKIFYGIIALFAVIGILLLILKRKRPEEVDVKAAWFSLVCCAAWAFTQSLFYIEGRHRWVVEPVMILFSAWAFLSVFKLYTKRRKGI